MHPEKYLSAVMALLIGGFLFSCSRDSAAYLYAGLHDHKEEQKVLVGLLNNEQDPQIRFALIDKIAYNLQLEGKIAALSVFLQSIVDIEPDNQYNAYFLLRLAAAYRQVHEDKIAAHYFEYVMQNYADMLVKGQSIHLLCLKNLIELSADAPKLVVYYSRLLTDFYHKFDPAYAYFMLAKAYEAQGEWRLAIQAYTQFLNLRRFDVIIPGIPDSYGYARKIVDYNASTKNWTFNTLDELVKTVSRAIRMSHYCSKEEWNEKTFHGSADRRIHRYCGCRIG